jgi:hypothetical protein
MCVREFSAENTARKERGGRINVSSGANAQVFPEDNVGAEALTP